MATFSVPTRTNVNTQNQEIFDNLEKSLGFVPNLYATLAHSPSALGDFLGFAGRKSSLSNKEKEVINLTVSQSNECSYCLAAHTAISQMNGFSSEEVIKLRSGASINDAKLDSLAAFVRNTINNNSKPSREAVTTLQEEGYTAEHIVDIALIIGEITVTNYLHGITQIPVDFPTAPVLEPVVA